MAEQAGGEKENGLDESEEPVDHVTGQPKRQSQKPNHRENDEGQHGHWPAEHQKKAPDKKCEQDLHLRFW